MYPTKDLLARTFRTSIDPAANNHKYVMLTRYRIIIELTGEVLANNMDQNEAHECYHFLELDHPEEVLKIESYTVHTVRGLGRDPDLH